MKITLRIIKVIKNLAILGFVLAYFLPVEENVPFGFLAAAASLSMAIEQYSLNLFFGFSPSLLVSFLILKTHKTKNWNFILLFVFSAIVYWGVLSWLGYPSEDNIEFWKADLDTAKQTLKVGYWLWNYSILSFLTFSLLESIFFSVLIWRSRKKDKPQEIVEDQTSEEG